MIADKAELQRFSDGLIGLRPDPTDETLATIAACLAEERIDALGAQAIARDAIVGTLKRFKDFRLERLAALPTSFRQLLLAYLRHDLALNGSLEHILTALRRSLLTQVTNGNDPGRFGMELIPALAVFCFAVEYVFAESADETAHLENLEKSATPLNLAMLGCYRPLNRTGSADRALAMLSVSEAFAHMIRSQILEPREELSLREKIPRLSPATDDISLAVASMYEENPYPRWKRLAPSPPEGHSFRRILIAGCGSGREAILMGKAFPGADIVAIDLSLSSLAQSMRRCGDFGVGNIRFFHCDLLEAHRLGQSFDHIACSGVLHHLRRPEYGLRALAGILDDGGLMRLELYRKGRRESIAAAIEMREQLGLEPTLGGIRALRAAIRALPPDHPAASVASEGDFFTASGCRDLLFHVQEHRYTLLDIDGLLHAAGMRLAAVKCGGDGIASKFHTRVPGSTRADLEAWDAFERARPGVHFGPMYRLLISR